MEKPKFFDFGPLERAGVTFSSLGGDIEGREHLVPDEDPGFLAPYGATKSVLYTLLPCDRVPEGREYRAVHVSGPSGTGKSSLVRQVCAKLRVPLYTVQVDMETTVQSLLTQPILRQENGASVTEYVPLALTEAMRLGGVCLINEVDLGSPFLVPALMSAAQEKEFYIPSLPEKWVKIHPLFRLAFTSNGGGHGDLSGDYAGTQRMNNAFRERCREVTLGYPDEDQELEIVRKAFSSSPSKIFTHGEDFLRALIRFANKTREAHATRGHGLTMAMSTRTLLFTVSCVLEDSQSPLYAGLNGEQKLAALAEYALDEAYISKNLPGAQQALREMARDCLGSFYPRA